jgi:hypothetical protein
MQTDDQLKAWILNKLKRRRFIGDRHTEAKNVRKGSPPAYHEKIDDLLGRLIRRDRLVWAGGKTRERHVALYPHLLGEIDSFVRQHYVETVF